MCYIAIFLNIFGMIGGMYGFYSYNSIKTQIFKKIDEMDEKHEELYTKIEGLSKTIENFADSSIIIIDN